MKLALQREVDRRTKRLPRRDAEPLAGRLTPPKSRLEMKIRKMQETKPHTPHKLAGPALRGYRRARQVRPGSGGDRMSWARFGLGGDSLEVVHGYRFIDRTRRT